MSISKISASVALMAMLLPVSSFAMKVPAVEPSSVFITGPLPPWSLRHTNAGTADHREFHKNADVTLKAWKEENKDRIGTDEYAKDLRAKLSSLNREHRAFHGWQEKTADQKMWLEKNASALSGTPAIGGMPSTLSPDLKNAISLLSESDFTPFVTEHRFEGTKPSSRLMREQASVRGIIR